MKKVLGVICKPLDAAEKANEVFVEWLHEKPFWVKGVFSFAGGLFIGIGATLL